MKKYSAIIFDLDGTIIDSKSGIIDSLKYSLKMMNKNDIDDEKLKTYIGLTLEEIYIKELKTKNEEIIRKAINYYREDFEKNGVYNNTLYNGIGNIIKELFENKYTLFIASIKPEKYTRLILRKYDLERYFTHIVGSGMNGEHNTKKELINMVIEFSQIDRSEFIMIGDRKGDIDGARGNEIDCIGVLYGYAEYREIEKAKSDYIVKDVKELRNIFLN